MNVRTEFETSYEQFVNYPCNLVHKAASPFALKVQKCHFDEAAPRLCVPTERDTNICVLEPPLPGDQDFRETEIKGDAALRTWLGDLSTIAPSTARRTGYLTSRRDPKCCFIFLWAAHSRASLKITRYMLSRLLSYFQITAGYLPFLFVFGLQTRPYGMRFGGFREQTLLSPSTQPQPASPLGRSGRQYQLCYNLKSVACKSSPLEPAVTKQWYIRQLGLCHQFDVVEGNALWMITKGSLDIKEHIAEMLGRNGRPQDRAFGSVQECFQSSLAGHLLLVSWACEGWRSHLEWLEEVTDEATKAAVIGPRGHDDARREYTPDDLQTVQQFEEKTNEAIVALNTNVEILTALRTYYEELLKNVNFPLQAACSEAVKMFSAQVKDAVYDLRMQISRAQLLLRITSDRKVLILQHLQTQATEKMETLTALAQKEAIAMRIITVVTLIFLPATFVSTFFSTQIVTYQNQDSSTSSGGHGLYESFSKLAMIRWIQVTFPLTAMTLVAGWTAYKWAQKRQRRLLPFYHAIELKTV